MADFSIKINHTNTENFLEIDALLDQKLSVLDKYLGTETDVLCEVTCERSANHMKGHVCTIEANFTFHGNLYHASATEDTFDLAIDEVASSLDKEIRRSQKKRDGLIKRGGRKIKEMLRFGN